MTKKHILYAMIFLVVAAALAGGGYWLYWNFFVRYSPITITQNQKEIQTLLESSGYAAAGTEGPELWVITYRNCATCKAWEDQETDKFAAVGVDVRIIPFAPVDIEGKGRSTPSERATVAEIWINRSYSLYQQWRATPEDLWNPELRPADGDLARTGVVDASRKFITDLEPLLAANGVPLRYPLVIWRDAEERIKVCACSDERMYHYVRDDLGVSSNAPIKPLVPIEDAVPLPTTPPVAAGTMASESAASMADYGPGAVE